MTSAIVHHLQSPDRDALEALIAEDAVFHSPVADYVGRADVVHLLSLIATVLQEVSPTRELGHGAATTTFLEARVEDRRLQGILDEHRDESGKIVDATLMLRPLAALRVAIAAMAAGLERTPLPSAGA